MSLLALSRTLTTFLFGLMLMPLQATLTFAKGSTAKAPIARAYKKNTRTKARPAYGFLPTTGVANLRPTIDGSLLPEFRSALVTYSKTLLGRPYRSGGKKPAQGFDCSGFTGYVFRQFGIALPSCSRSQSQIGIKIQKDSAQAGDLVFFGRKKRKGGVQIYHTGIVASTEGGRLRVIHSATGEGVVLTDMSRPGYWRKHLVSIRRVISEPMALVAAQ
jgi:cell wall-associated NlpC family hydrolase